MSSRLTLIYKKLFAHFGRQFWWPADDSFEVIIGAILTQNTNWSNVEKALSRLKQSKNLSADRLRRLPHKRLAELIRSAGYYNIKAKRIKAFLDFFFGTYQGSLKKMLPEPGLKLRRQLLAVCGIGPETADSILLYALNKPVFVVDAYTKRIFLRHGLIREKDDYQALQDLFMRQLEPNTKFFNEYHALLVKLGKEYCLKSKPKCQICPLNDQSKTFN